MSQESPGDMVERVFGPKVDIPEPLGKLPDDHKWELTTEPYNGELVWVPRPRLVADRHEDLEQYRYDRGLG